MKNSIPVFHAFTIKYPGLVDRIITELQISLAFDPNSHSSDATPQKYKTAALWDTGATRSVITKTTANILKLPSVGIVNVNHAGGTSIVNTYLTNFFLPNNVCIVGVLVSECPDMPNNVGAIIGMDILSKGDFSITNVNGQTCMTYRTPSIEQIDYVEAAKKIRFYNVGRNDPCPCGKTDSFGKPMKFKKCCGKSVS